MTATRRRGVALMLVLWLIIVLTTVGARVATSARSTAGVAANIRAAAIGRYAAESGVAEAAADLSEMLAASRDTAARGQYLNSLESIGAGKGEIRLGDAVFAISYVDVSSRLDINSSTELQLVRFFSFFTEPREAARAAQAVRLWIDPSSVQSSIRSLPSARLDVAFPRMPVARPLLSLEELRSIPGISAKLAEDAAPLLTVDGDGRINRATASDTVLVAAGGSLQDEPSRVLIVARGWLSGQPLTHEIQAVYAIEADRLVFVRWRERIL